MNKQIQNYLLQILDPDSVKKFISSFYKKLPLYIRTNTLKTEPEALKHRLERKGFILEKVKEIQEAFIVKEEPFPISKTIEHFAGLFYIQSLSSMLPSFFLDAKPGEYVLDIASAPGSKTTHIAQRMKNKGIIIANDVAGERLKVLAHNIDRLGILNTAISCEDGNRFGNLFPEIFDHVLVDAPCSALGIISKASEVINWWSFDEVKRLSNKQIQLLSSAIKAVKVGGTVIYSTCTLTVEENEMVIDQILKKYPVDVERINIAEVPTSPAILNYLSHVFDKRISNAIRIYPHMADTEGFFIVKLRKSDSTNGKREKEINYDKRKIKILDSGDSAVKQALDFLNAEFGFTEDIWKDFVYHFKDDELWISSREWIDFIQRNFKYEFIPELTQRIGVKLAKKVKHGHWKISTNALQIFSNYIQNNIIELGDENDVKTFINGGTIKGFSRDNLKVGSYVAVKFDGIVIGCGLITREGLKSQIPKGRRANEVEIL